MDKKNNMICDLETGICGPAGDDTKYNGIHRFVSTEKNN